MALEKIPREYSASIYEKIVGSLLRRIENLESAQTVKKIGSVTSDAAPLLKMGELGFVRNDTQNLDLVLRGDDGRLYRFSGQVAVSTSVVSAPAGLYVLKSGDTMTGLLILSGDPATALGAATKQYADTKVADTGDTMTGALVVDGSADAIQLRVQGHTTQTNFLLVLEDSAGNDQITMSNDGAVVINEEGNDADFRVESDGDANVLYVDASANTVQVGAVTASDSAKFYVSGKLSTSGEAEINGDLNHDGSNVGFYGISPAARPSAYTQTYSTVTRTHSNPTASVLTDNSGGTANTTVQALTNPADAPLTADALRDDLVANLIPELRNNIADLTAQINALIIDLANAKQVLNQVIDDHQSNGLLQ